LLYLPRHGVFQVVKESIQSWFKHSTFQIV
jgi:hypothetical protein